MTELAALYVRVPPKVMASLDRQVRATGRTKQAIVTEIVSGALAGDATPPGDRTVLTLAEVASMLRVPSDVVRQRIEAGELPGRRFGDDWRCSRDAVLRWLDGTDGAPKRKPGFTR